MKVNRTSQLCWYCKKCCNGYLCSQSIGITPKGVLKNKYNFIYFCPHFERDIGEMKQIEFVEKFKTSVGFIHKCMHVDVKQKRKELTNCKKTLKNLQAQNKHIQEQRILQRQIKSLQKILYICDNLHLLGDLDKEKIKEKENGNGCRRSYKIIEHSTGQF